MKHPHRVKTHKIGKRGKGVNDGIRRGTAPTHITHLPSPLPPLAYPPVIEVSGIKELLTQTDIVNSDRCCQLMFSS